MIDKETYEADKEIFDLGQEQIAASRKCIETYAEIFSENPDYDFVGLEHLVSCMERDVNCEKKELAQAQKDLAEGRVYAYPEKILLLTESVKGFQTVYDEGRMLYEKIKAAQANPDTDRSSVKNDIKSAGDAGENAVEYALKWLKPLGYKIIERNCHSNYSDACIMLANRDYIDEAQEFDHIVVGKSGIILVETKNYAGTITISDYGDWIQTKKGERRGIKNPVQQCDRHEALMRSIVGAVPITSVICLANDNVIIENRENCDLPIVNASLLQRFIEKIPCKDGLEDWKIEEIVVAIESHKVNRL